MSRRGGLFGPDPVGYDGEGWELVRDCKLGEKTTEDTFRYQLPHRSRQIERELREYVERERSKGDEPKWTLEEYENIADQIHLVRIGRLQEEREQQNRMKDYLKRGEEERPPRGNPPRISRQQQRDVNTVALGWSLGTLGGLAYSYGVYQSGQYDKWEVAGATIFGTMFLPIITTGIALIFQKK